MPVVKASDVAAMDSDFEAGGGTDDTDALQVVLDDLGAGKGGVLDLCGDTALVRGLRTYSNTEVRNGALYLADGSDVPILMNANWRNHLRPMVDHNITYRDLRLNCNGMNQRRYWTPGLSIGTNWVNGAPTEDGGDGTNMRVPGVVLYGASNCAMHNVESRNSGYFGFYLANFPHFRATGLRRYSTDDFNAACDNGTPRVLDGTAIGNTDGVNIHGVFHNTFIDGVYSNGRDDVVGCDWSDFSQFNPTNDPEVSLGWSYGTAQQSKISNIFCDGAPVAFRLMGVGHMSGADRMPCRGLVIEGVYGWSRAELSPTPSNSAIGIVQGLFDSLTIRDVMMLGSIDFGTDGLPVVARQIHIENVMHPDSPVAVLIRMGSTVKVDDLRLSNFSLRGIHADLGGIMDITGAEIRRLFLNGVTCDAARPIVVRDGASIGLLYASNSQFIAPIYELRAGGTVGKCKGDAFTATPPVLPSTFGPAGLPGCQAWLKAADGGRDRSGNGNHDQSTGSARATYNPTGNPAGGPVATLDGIGQTIELPAMPGATTVLLVCNRPSNATSFGEIFGFGPNGGNLQQYGEGDEAIMQVGADNIISSGGGNLNLGFVAIQASFEADEMRLFIRSYAIGTQALATPPNTDQPLFVGSKCGIWNFIGLEILEVAVFDHVLTTAQRAAWLAYVNAEYPFVNAG